MAVQPQTPYKEYTANGSTNSFALEFDCDNQDHLIVLVDDIEPVVGAWSLIGGAVVFGTAPTNGKKITIQRNTPFRRDGDFQSYDNSFRPGPVNKGFDWVWLKLQELGVADWILSSRIDALKAYVDDQDDELRAYLLEEIRKQGVALDQLDDYYNYLMQRLAQIAVDKGWDASFVVDGDKTQKQVNDISKSVINVVELRNLRGVKNGDTVRTLGHTEIGLGGGTYTFEALSSKTDNNGSYIASSVAAGTWVLVSDLHFEIFGVSTSVADNAPLINSALDFAAQSNREISFEKPNEYTYDTDIVIAPILDSGFTDFKKSLIIKFNGAKLKPLSKNTLGELIIARDNVTIYDLAMNGGDVKSDGIRTFSGCAINFGVPFAKDNYTNVRKSVQHVRLICPNISHYKYSFKFHVSWSVYYTVMLSPEIFETYYGYKTVTDVNSGANQLTRMTLFSPKHVGGACTFMLDNAETVHTFGGGSEFIRQADVDNILPDNLPITIYTANENLGETGSNPITGHCTFKDYDIERCYRAVKLDGVLNNWNGRFVGRSDSTGVQLDIDNTVFTGSALTINERLGNQNYGVVGADANAGANPKFYLKSNKTVGATSQAGISHMMTQELTPDQLFVSIYRDPSIATKFFINLSSVVDHMRLSRVSPSSNNDGGGFTILGQGANGTRAVVIKAGLGTPEIQSIDLADNSIGSLRFDCAFIQPKTDNTTGLGVAGLRFKDIYAANGVIQTSDARTKQQIRDLSESEKRVAIKLKSQIKAFKFNDAVNLKGDSARIHFGVIAQEVKAAFEYEGLVAEDYAILCYDEWDAEYRDITEEITVTNEAGEEVTETVLTGERELVHDAGNRYGVRYDELLAFIISAI